MKACAEFYDGIQLVNVICLYLLSLLFFLSQNKIVYLYTVVCSHSREIMPIYT